MVASFPAFSFDRFQYAELEGEGLVYFIAGMTSVSVDKGGEGSLIERTHFVHASLSLEQGAVHLLHERLKFKCLGPKPQCTVRPQARSLDWGSPPPHPPLSYLGRHWCHSHEKISQVFSLRFYILQAIKSWSQERPVGRASSYSNLVVVKQCLLVDWLGF